MENTLLSLRGLTKTYPGVLANDDVSFDIGTGAPLQADISNVSSDIEEFTFKAGEEYWVYWRKADTLVLGD